MLCYMSTHCNYQTQTHTQAHMDIKQHIMLCTQTDTR